MGTKAESAEVSSKNCPAAFAGGLLSTKMARLRGRSLRGERCRAAIPHGHWKTTTFVGASRLNGMTAPLVLDGAVSGIAFRDYVEQVLVPTLSR